MCSPATDLHYASKATQTYKEIVWADHQTTLTVKPESLSKCQGICQLIGRTRSIMQHQAFPHVYVGDGDIWGEC